MTLKACSGAAGHVADFTLCFVLDRALAALTHFASDCTRVFGTVVISLKAVMAKVDSSEKTWNADDGVKMATVLVLCIEEIYKIGRAHV